MPRNKTETQITLKVPDDLTADQRLDVGIAVLQFINDRTREGKNVFGRDWAGKAGRYTEEYAKKVGKSPSGPVDLALSNEMLGKMKYFTSKSRRGEITIGFDKGTKVERKAEGNIQGTYGGKSDGSKARPFLDILKKDLDMIIAEVT